MWISKRIDAAFCSGGYGSESSSEGSESNSQNVKLFSFIFVVYPICIHKK
jgi:hypothetical protein